MCFGPYELISDTKPSILKPTLILSYLSIGLCLPSCFFRLFDLNSMLISAYGMHFAFSAYLFLLYLVSLIILSNNKIMKGVLYVNVTVSFFSFSYGKIKSFDCCKHSLVSLELLKILKIPHTKGTVPGNWL